MAGNNVSNANPSGSGGPLPDTGTANSDALNFEEADFELIDEDYEDESDGEGDEGEDLESENVDDDDLEDDGLFADEVEESLDIADDDADAEANDAQALDTKVSDDTEIELSDGKKATVSELKLGYLRETDYRQKTESLGEDRRAISDLSGRIEGTVKALADFFEENSPPEPDPALAHTNTQLYVQQKAAYDLAQIQIQNILDVGQQNAQSSKELSAADQKARVEHEAESLVRKMPHLRDPVKFAEFQRRTAEAARTFGFSDTELKASLDHRLMHMGHYALIGVEALKARKAGKAPKGKAGIKPGNKAAATRGARKAPDVKAKIAKSRMARLTKTGSFQDAMKIDVGD